MFIVSVIYIIYKKEPDAFGNTHTQAKNDYWIDAFCDSLSAIFFENPEHWGNRRSE